MKVLRWVTFAEEDSHVAYICILAHPDCTFCNCLNFFYTRVLIRTAEVLQWEAFLEGPNVLSQYSYCLCLVTREKVHIYLCYFIDYYVAVVIKFFVIQYIRFKMEFVILFLVDHIFFGYLQSLTTRQVLTASKGAVEKKFEVLNCIYQLIVS